MSITTQLSVKELRTQQGWSQNDLSSFSGLSVKTIQRIEKGKGVPSLETAKALGAVFNSHFSSFLPSEETSTQQCKDSAAPKKPTSSRKSADLRANFLHYAFRYRWPAIIALVIATLFGSITQLYFDVQSLSTDVSELAPAKSIELASAQSSGFPQIKYVSNGGKSYFDYFGDSVLTEGSLVYGNVTDQPLSLLELIMMRETAAIISHGAELAKLSSDSQLSTVLEKYAQCYDGIRTLSDQAINKILKMQNCTYEVLSDANWSVYPEMDLALEELSRSMKEKGPAVRQFMLLNDAQKNDRPMSP